MTQNKPLSLKLPTHEKIMQKFRFLDNIQNIVYKRARQFCHKASLISQEKNDENVKSVHDLLNQLKQKKFPLPQKLHPDHFNTLCSLKERKSRIFYLDALNFDKADDEFMRKLTREDEEMNLKWTSFDRDLFLEAESVVRMADRSEFSRRIRMINSVHVAKISEGGEFRGTLKKSDLVRLLSCKNEKEIREQFDFMLEIRDFQSRCLITKRKIGRERLIKKREKEEREKGHILYGLNNNGIFLRRYKSSMKSWDAWRVIREDYPDWNQSLVLDFSFLSDMNYRQLNSLFLRELHSVMKNNSECVNPFRIFLTGLNAEDAKFQRLLQAFPGLNAPVSPVHVSERSYLDLFDRGNLVYLTPDTDDVLEEFNPEDVYVIGGFVDEYRSSGHTLEAAKRDKIRHAKLPLKRFLGTDDKLYVHEVAAVLNDFRRSRDWFFAMRNVSPVIWKKRVLRLKDVNADEDELNRAKLECKARIMLNPKEKWKTRNLSPEEYKRRYDDIVAAINT